MIGYTRAPQATERRASKGENLNLYFTYLHFYEYPTTPALDQSEEKDEEEVVTLFGGAKMTKMYAR